MFTLDGLIQELAAIDCETVSDASDYPYCFFCGKEITVTYQRRTVSKLPPKTYVWTPYYGTTYMEQVNEGIYHDPACLWARVQRHLGRPVLFAHDKITIQAQTAINELPAPTAPAATDSA